MQLWIYSIDCLNVMIMRPNAFIHGFNAIKLVNQESFTAVNAEKRNKMEVIEIFILIFAVVNLIMTFMLVANMSGEIKELPLPSLPPQLPRIHEMLQDMNDRIEKLEKRSDFF